MMDPIYLRIEEDLTILFNDLYEKESIIAKLTNKKMYMEVVDINCLTTS